MKIKLIRKLVLCLIAFITIPVVAQSDYLAEIGVNGGTSYYLGDANSVMFQNQKLNYGIIYRYNFNERFSAHAEWNNSKIIVPQLTDTITVTMLDFCGEFNFFDIVKKQYKPQSKSFSPYIFTGISAAYNTNDFILGIPFGIGLKYKLGTRLTFNTKWAHRILFRDKIDRIDNPALLNGTNIFNNDILSTLTIGISYNFWKKPCDCQNNR